MTLHEHGYPDEGEYEAQGSYPRADSFEYVTHGKIYRIEDESMAGENTRLSAYVSFGGLLMRLQGDADNLHGNQVDANIYLLMKKVSF